MNPLMIISVIITILWIHEMLKIIALYLICNVFIWKPWAAGWKKIDVWYLYVLYTVIIATK